MKLIEVCFSLAIFNLRLSRSTKSWYTCEAVIENKLRGVEIINWGHCFVPNKESIHWTNDVLVPVIPSTILTQFGCFNCEPIGNFMSYVVPFFVNFYSIGIDGQWINDTYLKGVLAFVAKTNATSRDIMNIFKINHKDVPVNKPWFMLDAKFEILDLNKNLSDSPNIEDHPNLTLSVINTRTGNPKWFDAIRILSGVLTTTLCFTFAMLIRKFDKNFFIYSLDLFLNCKATNNQATLGVYIARLTPLCAFFAAVSLIFLSVIFTLLPIPMQYILDLTYVLTSVVTFMFLSARLILVRKNSLKLRMQRFLLLPGSIFGLIFAIIIVLFKDQAYLGDIANKFVGMFFCWWIANFLFCLAMLLHFNFYNFISLASFEIGLIIMDQLFRTIPYTNADRPFLEPDNFITNYFMYYGPDLEISKGTYFRENNYSEKTCVLEIPTTNPFVFKFHLHYGNLICPVFYSRFYPIWYVILPGLCFMHCVHFNNEHSSNSSNVFTIALAAISITCTSVEDVIRRYLFELGTALLSFPLMSAFALVWFKLRGELGKFVHGVRVFAALPAPISDTTSKQYSINWFDLPRLRWPDPSDL